MNIDVVTTVLAPAASYDLTDLTTVKEELALKAGDTSKDAWLGRAISQVSRAVMNDTNRVFSPEYVQDVFDVRRNRYQVPNGASFLQLSRWPVLAVTSVVLTLAASTQALTEGVDFRVDYASGALWRLDANTGRVTAWEAQEVTAKYSSGYGAAVQETHSVPADPGPYTVTVSQTATFSCDQTVSYSNGTALTTVKSSPLQGQYTVSSTTGVYTFNAADAGEALSFAYCTEAVPDDLVDAALRLVTGRYKARDRDPTLIQRETPGVGTERFWFGGAPGQTGPFPPDIKGLLDNYKVPVVS